ncbi:MAG: hypothetical protein H0T73_20315 [Ardenticatenales bacterium]|nr:hypothetical protein [Ardenticatenales bacterium]
MRSPLLPLSAGLWALLFAAWGGTVGKLVGGWVGTLLRGEAGLAGGSTAGALAGSILTGLMGLAAMRVATSRNLGIAWRFVAVLVGGLVVGGLWGLMGGVAGALLGDSIPSWCMALFFLLLGMPLLYRRSTVER